ncbi:MMPL family transporter, partial [Streptomyces sp. SID3212]
MATLLYRLGRSCFRRRRLVFACWLTLMAAVIAVSAAFGGTGRLDDEFSIPGSESQQALDVMGRAFPGGSGTSAQLVFTAPAGGSVEEAPFKAAIDDTLARAARAPQVADVTAPEATGTVSADGGVAVAQVGYRVSKSDLDADSLDALDATAAPA